MPTSLEHRTEVLGSVTDGDDIWDATLRVDDQHPFYFDHPLDHVPAALLVEGVRALAERAAGGPDAAAVVGLHLAVGAFAELDAPVVLELTRSATEPGAATVVITQAGRVVGAGTTRTAAPGVPELPDAEAVPHEAGPVVPAPAELAHRARPENLLVGGIRSLGGRRWLAPVLAPPEGHHLRELSPHAVSLTEVVEAARQLAVVLMHTQGVPRDNPFIVSAVTVDLDHAVPRDRPLVLDAVAPPLAGSSVHEGSGTLLAGGHPVGRVRFVGRVMNRRVYERLRGAAAARLVPGDAR